MKDVIENTRTWQECYDAGMTAREAAAARGKSKSSARWWANRNKLRWPIKGAQSGADVVPAVAGVKGSNNRGEISLPAAPWPKQRISRNVSGVGGNAVNIADVSIPRCPWGEINLDDRSESAPSRRVIKVANPPKTRKTRAEKTIEIIREMHSEHMANGRRN